jgi:uncharacterized membrane protein YoaK (UPF0700 family)
MKLSLSALLSLNAGYVDAVGYLALQGLFTAHVTGNFVTVGAALVFGTSGVVTKLSALPVFCVVVVLTRIVSYGLPAGDRNTLTAAMTLKFVLLLLGAVLAIFWGPFIDRHSSREWVTGMILVAAMAIQNATDRIHLSSTPPSTIMTGNTTQIMIDLADCLRGLPPDARRVRLARLKQMSTAVAAFAVGAAFAAVLYSTVSMWSFAGAPLLAGLASLAVKWMPTPTNLAPFPVTPASGKTLAAPRPISRTSPAV